MPKTPSSPAVLLLGEPGRGKTFSLGTLAARKKLFYLYTDPGGDESLLDSLEHHKVPVSNVHWHYVQPASTDWGTLKELATKVNALDYQSLAGIKSGIDKSKHRQFFELVAVLADFTCERTGKSFGPVDSFGPECALAFDSLTGLNKIAKDTTVGAKPTLHEGEWGTAMAMEEVLIRQFVAAVKCPRVMIGHLDRIVNEVAGNMTFTVSLLGKKLAPQIPHLFSDVIFAYSEGPQFYWSTMDDRISLKTRNLPIAQKQKPDFGAIIDKWEARVKRAEETGVEDGGSVAGDTPADVGVQ